MFKLLKAALNKDHEKMFDDCVNRCVKFSNKNDLETAKMYADFAFEHIAKIIEKKGNNSTIPLMMLAAKLKALALENAPKSDPTYLLKARQIRDIECYSRILVAVAEKNLLPEKVKEWALLYLKISTDEDISEKLKNFDMLEVIKV